PVLLRATEGFTQSIRGLARTVLPLISSLIVTSSLSDRKWRGIGWQGCETLGDSAHLYVYAQRTPDGRIAIGGRGVPYRFGSRTDAQGEIARSTVAGLRSKLAQMLPPAGEIPIDHAWSGVLGVARDWCPTVAADRLSGIAW